MGWPFGASGSGAGARHEGQRRRSDSPTAPERGPLAAAREYGPMALMPLLGFGALRLYTRVLRRIPGVDHVRPSLFRKGSIFGRVTSVGDGDNFHLFHTPGGKAAGWGWLRKVPETRKELKDRTIAIRIAGVDAPEGAHFGRPAQPHATEALAWLSNYILRRDVRAYVYRRDQYNRVIATVYVRRFLFRRDVGLEMLKQGLATTYEAKTGAEYGGRREAYEKAEAQAKRKRKGIWAGKASAFESPRDYKTKWAGHQDKNG